MSRPSKHLNPVSNTFFRACVQWIYVIKRCVMWHFFGCTHSPGGLLHFTQTHQPIHTLMHTNTHTAGVLDMAQHFSRWPGCYAISHHSNMRFFLFLSPSLVLREGKWQTRFFHKGWGCIFLPLLLCFICMCMLFLSTEQKDPSVFFMSGVQRARQSFIFKWEGLRMKGRDQEVLGVFL